MIEKFGKGWFLASTAALLVAVSILWVPQSAAALRVTVSAQGDSPQARTEALALAVDQGVQLLTGRPIGAPPELREKASEYVLSYKQRRDGQASGRNLDIVLDDGRLAQDLPNYGLFAWRDDRPEILVWVAVDEGGGRRWLDAELDDAWQSHLSNRAKALGYKLLFPINDTEDQRSLPIAALWGEADVQVRQAAKRYAARTVMAGRLQTVGPQRWASVWNLYTDAATRWEIQSDSVPRTLVSAFDAVADALAIANQPKSRVALSDELIIDVSGVRDLRDYSAVNQVFSRLRMVKSYSARAVQGERLRFSVTVTGDERAFLTALQSDGSLLSAPSMQASDANVLWYRLKN